MAHRIVDETSLKTVADAIREKAGTSDSLVFPTGFADAIAGIQAGGGSDEEWFNDGDTHIWITLPEGRTSPCVVVTLNGTMTVDWGDGTTPDTLTGTNISASVHTPNHEYSSAGDYIIRLTVDGEMGFYANSGGSHLVINSYSTVSDLKYVYNTAIKKIEIGNAVKQINNFAFRSCFALSSIAIPNSVTSIGDNVFYSCYGLSSVVIPNGVTSVGGSTFYSCYSLSSIVIPNSVTSIGGNMFSSCYSLSSIVIPNGVTSIGGSAFYNCYSLSSVVIPNGVTSIGSNAFKQCHALSNITIPSSVTSIGGGAFSGCHYVEYYDFTKHTAIPTLGDANVFYRIGTDCEIRVPAALYDEWIAATNWSTYANNIVAV